MPRHKHLALQRLLNAGPLENGGDSQTRLSQGALECRGAARPLSPPSPSFRSIPPSEHCSGTLTPSVSILPSPAQNALTFQLDDRPGPEAGLTVCMWPPACVPVAAREVLSHAGWIRLPLCFPICP